MAGAGLEGLEAVVILLVVVAVLVVFVLFILPVLIFLAEVMIVGLVVGVGSSLRRFFGDRSWWSRRTIAVFGASGRFGECARHSR